MLSVSLTGNNDKGSTDRKYYNFRRSSGKCAIEIFDQNIAGLHTWLNKDVKLQSCARAVGIKGK